MGLTEDLLHEADPNRAFKLQRYFKTGPGEYAAGDRFLGLTLPVIRQTIRNYQNLTLKELEKHLQSSWHEERLAALIILTQQFPKASNQEKIVKFYLKNTRYINNWDLVDVSCSRILGAYYYPNGTDSLMKLAKSKSLWEQRMAIISTLYNIREGELTTTLTISQQLLHHPHDLIHKAVGWCLREVGKKDQKVLMTFLDRYAPEMPRTMLRYAIERFPETRRKKYLAVPRKSIK